MRAVNSSVSLGRDATARNRPSGELGSNTYGKKNFAALLNRLSGITFPGKACPVTGFFKAFDQAQENAAVISALQSFSSSMGSFLPDLSEQILERGRAVQAWQFPVYGLCASTQA